MAKPPEEPFPEFGPVPEDDASDGSALPWIEDQIAAKQAAQGPKKIEPPKLESPPIPELGQNSTPAPLQLPKDRGVVGEVQIPCPTCGKGIGSRSRLCPFCHYEFKDFTPAPIKVAAQPPSAAPVSAKAVRPPEFTDKVEELKPRRENPLIFAFVGLAAAAFAWSQLRVTRVPPEAIDPQLAVEPVKFPEPPPGMPPPPERQHQSPFGENYTPQTQEPRAEAVPNAAPPPPPAGSVDWTSEGSDWMFSGKVRDVLTLKPVSGVELKFVDYKSGKSKGTKTDGRGRFKVKLPVPDSDGYYMKIDKPGYLDRFVHEGEQAALENAEQRRERAQTASRTVQGFPFSPMEMGRLELDVLLVPAGIE